MAERSLSFDSALQDLAGLLHRLSLAQMVPGAFGEDDPDAAAVRELAPLFAAEDLQLYYQIAIQGRGDLGLAPDEQAGFVMTLLRMLAFAPGGAPAGVARPAPAGTAAAAPAAAEPAPSKKNPDDNSWQSVIEQLGLSGMARMLAQHCELLRQDTQRIELRISNEHRHLLDGPYEERLKQALQRRFGAKVRVSVQPAERAGDTPAVMADRDRKERQARAIAAIEQDPFVRDLVDNLDARVIESTIKPVQ